MKKLKIFIIVILSLSLLFVVFMVFFGGITLFRHFFMRAPDRITETWQTVTIDGSGSFRVPTEWNVEEHDEILYITDRPMANGDYVVYIAGRIGLHAYAVFDEVEQGRVRSSRGFLNTASLFLNEYTVDGVIQEHYMIEIHNMGIDAPFSSYSLFVWDREVVDRWHAEQIAKSFLSTRYANLRENAMGG